MSLKLAIFDLDGTLVDSRKIIQAAMVRSFEENGLIPPEYEQTRRIVGLGLAQACQILAPDVSGQQLEQLVDETHEEQAEGHLVHPPLPSERKPTSQERQ